MHEGSCDSERKAVLDVLHSEPFMDQSPPEVYATLLSQGIYAARRQGALDSAYAAHSERFLNGPRIAGRPPAAVHINPPCPSTTLRR